MKYIGIILSVLMLSGTFIIQQTFGGTSVNITSASVDLDTNILTLRGVNFDIGSGVLYVSIGGVSLTNCSVTSTEVICDITGQTLPMGTYAVSVSAGNAPGRNDEIDVYIPSGSSGMCSLGIFTSCYTGDTSTIGVGECQTGISTCLQSGQWGECSGEVLPVDENTTEKCSDNKDNDCDGYVDCSDSDCDSLEVCAPPICVDADTDGCFVGEGCPGVLDCDDLDPSVCQGCDFCVWPWLECDHTQATVCETNVSIDNNNCGSCGNSCGSLSSCINGVCVP